MHKKIMNEVNRETLEEYCGFPLPKLKDVRSSLRYNPYASCREKVLNAFIIGSTAKFSRNADSDIDIAVIIPNKKRRTSIRFTEMYHQKFLRERDVPTWHGKKIDFQFYYESEISQISSFPKMNCAQ